MKKIYLFITIFSFTFLRVFAQTGSSVADSSKQQQNILQQQTIADVPFDAANTLKLADTLKLQANLVNGQYFSIATYKRIKSDSEIHQPFPDITDDVLQAGLLKKVTLNMDKLKTDFADDTLYGSPRQKMPPNINILKQQVSLISNDSLRAQYYHTIASYYLRYDSITVRRTRQAYQEGALEYTMKAVHAYSKYNDWKGLRASFNNLVKIYRDQRKFVQAKWFVLQSNTISRDLKDVPNTITSLVDLAGIQMSINEYELAQTDLNEALSLSSKNHLPKHESIVQQNLAMMYDHLNETKKSLAAMKRHDFLEDSIIKAQNAKALAAVKAQDSVKMAKKKLLTSTVKATSKTNSSKKTASL